WEGRSGGAAVNEQANWGFQAYFPTSYSQARADNFFEFFRCVERGIPGPITRGIPRRDAGTTKRPFYPAWRCDFGCRGVVLILLRRGHAEVSAGRHGLGVDPFSVLADEFDQAVVGVFLRDVVLD